MLRFMLSLGLSGIFPEVAATCLSNGTEPWRLENLVNPNGETYPVGIYVQNWAAGYVTSYLAGTIIKEVLGYNVSYNGPGPDTASGIFALAGCRTPGQVEDRGCDAPVTYNHVNLENWKNAGYEGIWNEAQKVKGLEPKDLASSGYAGKVSIYLPTPVRDEAYAEKGLPLEYFGAWDADWKDPAPFFGDVGLLNRSLLKPCSATSHYSESEVANFLAQTGDVGGVKTLPDGRQVGNCYDDYLWLAPSCRSNVSRCVLFVTGGNGWSMDEMRQKAVRWNMPLAIGVANSWSGLVLSFKSTFYWWVPDPTFLDLQPQELVFPANDKLAFQRGDKTTQSESADIRTTVSKDLNSLAPKVEAFLEGLKLDLETVNAMLLDQKQQGDGWEEVACRWLNANKDTWEAWLPDDTKCFAGFGLYDELAGQFVENREVREGKRCQACPSGHFSSQLVDSMGQTYICVPCPMGMAQSLGAQTFCEPCSKGEHQDETGAQSCKRCALGSYQDQQGMAVCTKCPAGSRTLGPGAVSFSECGCEAGRIDISDALNTSSLKCVECGEGFECPMMGSKQSLLTGNHSMAAAFVSSVAPGYYVTRGEPLKAYKCGKLTDCPGGLPEQCAGGRVGIPCATCAPGETWTDGECQTCEGWLQALWALGLTFIFIFLTASYYLMTSKVTAKASVLFTTTCAFGMLVSLLQSVGIIGMMTVDFPLDIMRFFSVFRVLLLDLDSFGFACFAGADTAIRYWMSILFFPAAVCWLLFNYAVSRLMPKHSWDWTKTASCTGQVLQVSFSTMSAIAMAPMMCYTHPNQQQSVLKYPNVLCGSSEHTVMLIGGLLLLIIGVLGFLTLCTYAAIQVPHWSAREKHHLVRCFRFLVFRFRLDSWWFGVPLLTRGPLISLPIVLATDYQSVQTMFVTLILALFLLIQALAWPWKVPMLNALDSWMSYCIMVLVAGTALYVEPASKGLTSNFVDAFSLAIMVVIFGSIGLMILMSLAALIHRSAMGTANEYAIFNMQKTMDSEQVAAKMKDMAELLAGMSPEELCTALDGLSVFDTRRVTDFMTLTGAELIFDKSARFSFNTRVSSASFSGKK